MSSQYDQMIKEGIRLYKAKKIDEARSIWEKVTEQDQYNEQAWLWLSAVVEGNEEKRICLENVLFINPNNTNARKGLDVIAAEEAKAAADKAAAERAAAAAKATPPPVEPPKKSAYSAPPTETSSASSDFVPEETPPEIYDDWIGSLNIGSKKPTSTSPLPSVSPFTMPDDLSFGEDEDEDEEVYTAPYKPGTDSLDSLRVSDDYDSAPSRQKTSAFTDFDDDDEPINFNKVLANDDVEDDFTFDDDPFAETNLTSGPFSAAALDTDGYADITSNVASSRSPSAGKGTSIGERDAGRSSGSRGMPAPAPTASDADPSEYFAMIPTSIKATRLPGTDEKHPALIRLLLILLILLNLGSLGFLVAQLTGVLGS